ncbi:glycerophosphodiester phosphodiesterase [Pedobacter psychrophilus]|uniref:Glycerophosphodiester phosphodiesterase n=1 Tax=Pedobacter psychrophilus TaxID=1826909 RepID=A0A179DFM8_9SPHI|nr:glycerophosphodiester phosphodiesterase family protein [Pedobacter psychrophilus]OAQ39319.1 glycerophosphodiester phosphodiesterase [Pedobacter psychrophilus]
MKIRYSITFFFLIIITACKSTKPSKQSKMEFPKFDIEAHRGGRGLMPENSIPAMLNALAMGVNTLEMDTHITKDGQVVVTHDDYLSPAFILQPNKEEIPKSEAQKNIIYQMPYADLKRFDIGSKYYPAFPQQKKINTSIPLLSDIIDAVQSDIDKNNRKQIFYNIETKCSEKGDGILHPNPDKFVELLINIIKEKKITSFVIIQSFDKRTIQIINKKNPEIKTAYLISNKKTFEENIKELGYKPFIYNPEYHLVNKDLILKCHQQNIKIIPWTVNTLEEINLLKNLGVDGVITDYPNLLLP